MIRIGPLPSTVRRDDQATTATRLLVAADLADVLDGAA